MEDKFEPQNRNDDSINYNSPNVSSEWPFSSSNLTNTSHPISSSNPIEGTSCSSASMVDSFCGNIWDQPTNSQGLGFGHLQNNVSTSSTLGFRKDTSAPLGPLEMSWFHQNPSLKGAMFMPNAPSVLPQSLSPFPADSGFIERAARFSCFNAGNISDMINPYAVHEALNPYPRGLASVQGTVPEGFAGSGLKTVSGGQAQENELSIGGGSKDVSMNVGCDGNDGSQLRNDEAKLGGGVSGNESEEADFSQEETSNKGLGSKKRKRTIQDSDFDQAKGSTQPTGEATRNNTESQPKADQNPSSGNNRSGAKQAKQGSQASDTPKEDYIHVRARRGQATNSHSLAERVRREKISERMKFLQDLVPGCSKVTGKAVMLDEIINYVQSLQRQVEFLSMKLATVNPRLDFNIEALLAKDILQSRAGPSSGFGFPPDMAMSYPPLNSSQLGILQAGFPGLGSSSNPIGRSINSHLATITEGFKEPNSQVPNVWDEELHNIIQMGLNPNIPLTSQDLGTLPPGHLKPEP